MKNCRTCKNFGTVGCLTLSSETATFCKNYGFVDYRPKNIELVEENKMDIKINRKAAMTEGEQRAAIIKLLREYKNATTANIGYSTSDFVAEAMTICKNEPREVESVEIEVPEKTCIRWTMGNGRKSIILPIEYIKQIQAIKL